MSKLAKALTAAAGNAGESLYVEDVFSTYLYEGNGATQTITNDIDLDGEGGMVWIKDRSTSYNNVLFDTERGATNYLKSNDPDGQSSIATLLTSFNNNGFDIGSQVTVNNNGDDYASWTFRKAEKFFDVVTYTGTGSTTTVSHNLGSTPGFIIVKRTDSAEDWTCYHTGVPGAANYIQLNKTDAYASNSSVFNNTAPTDSVFTVGSSGRTNASGGTYVAYLFASDAGGFGDDESIIKCGSYTGTGAAGNEVNLGFEPQWLMFKRTDSTSDWSMFDVMRGIATGGNDARLRAQGSDAENEFNYVDVTSTGFSLSYGGTDMNASGGNYIYIAIRRPMKTPESGTEVFAAQTYTGDGSNTRQITSGFPIDMFMSNRRTDPGNSLVTRLLGVGDNSSRLITSSTADEQSGVYSRLGMDYWQTGNGTVRWENTSGTDYVSWMFKRATGFFDVVAYTGDGVAGHTINHNLGVAPEWIICKKRSSGGSFNDWYTVTSAYYNTNPYDRNSALNSTNGFTGGGWVSAADSTSFTISNAYAANENTYDYIAYLFASVAGVSKIGTYTGTGSDVNVDCGFSSGARFVYIQRADATGDGKYVWDSERGIVAGNDPYLLLNSTAAEVTSTDYIDPLSSGFTVTSSAPAGLNTSGGTYFFLAIA